MLEEGQLGILETFPTPHYQIYAAVRTREGALGGLMGEETP